MLQYSFDLISPVGLDKYVQITRVNSETGETAYYNIFASSKIALHYSTLSQTFSLYENGKLYFTFEYEQVTLPLELSDIGLLTALSEMFGQLPSVAVSIPDPINANVVNFPSEFGAINGTTPFHVTIDNFPATQTISGTVSTIQPGVLLKRFPVLLNVPFIVKAGATEIFDVKVINSGGSRQFVKLCDTLAIPTVGTTPVFLTFDGLANNTNFVSYGDAPRKATNGVWAYSVRGILDSDTTAPASGCICEIGYR